MTDLQLAADCVELADIRAQLAALADRDSILAADIIAVLIARGLDFVDYRKDRRALMERPERREVDLERFRNACAAHNLDPDEVAAATKLSVGVREARKLLGDKIAFDSICTVTPGAPRLRLVTTVG